MMSRRRLGLAVTAAVAASVMLAGASALAAAGVTHGNYRGPARPAHVIMRQANYSHRTNYQGPARRSARAAARPGSNRPPSAAGR